MDTRPYLRLPKGFRKTQKNLEKYANLQASGLYNTRAETPPAFDFSSDKGPGSRHRKRMANMTDEDRRKMHEMIVRANSTPYVPKCRCDEAEEEYQSLLRGAPKPADNRIRCTLHMKSAKRLPSMKKHPIPEHLVHLLQTARVITPGPIPTMTVNTDACIELDGYLGELRSAGFELKRTNKGVALLVNNNDPYGVLEKENAESSTNSTSKKRTAVGSDEGKKTKKSKNT